MIDAGALPFAPEVVARADGPLVAVELGNDGLPVFARALTHVNATTDRIWSAISEVEKYAERVPMIHRARVDGDQVKIDLKFRISLFSVGFAFEAHATHEEERFIELMHVRGEPSGLKIRFDLVPLETAGSTLLMSSIGFEIASLGWLVKFFLKHHPEIQFGVYPGCALALLDGMKRAAEGR